MNGIDKGICKIRGSGSACFKEPHKINRSAHPFLGVRCLTPAVFDYLMEPK